jgi:YfiH family protein
MTSQGKGILPFSNTFQCHRKNGLPLYRFSRLSDFNGLEHAVFTRLGGISSPPFASLNVSYDTKDDAGKVSENLSRVRSAMEASPLIYARQIHGNNILLLHEQTQMDLDRPYPFEGFDGFITKVPGVVMLVKVADCQPIFLFEAKHKVAGLIHTGWRGSVQNILGKAVYLMEAQFQCRAQDIVAAIGPSLGPCCAEFRNWRQELPSSFSRFQVAENHFDFWAISQDQLQEAGLPRENIETAHICTKCNPEVFYSYRGERRTGRFAAAMGLKNES